MKKLLLSAALVAAACAPAAADDYDFLISTHCENNQPVGFVAAEEGKTYELEPEMLFGMMYECAAYIKVGNNSSADVKCDINLEKEYDNCVFGENKVAFQTCLAGTCQTGAISVDVKAGEVAGGTFGDHIGYSLTVRDGKVPEDLKIDSKYNVTVKLGDTTRKFSLVFSNASAAVDTIGVAGGEAVYYNLQGMPVSEPEAGQMYIVRQGSKVTKVIR